MSEEEDHLAKNQQRLWSQLREAPMNKDHPWRVMSLATVTVEGSPQIRQVVLREVSEEKRQLLFYTDPRTPKWKQLAAQPQAEVLFWDGEEKVQLRCRGEVRLHCGDELANLHQATVPEHMAGDYAAPVVPGQPLADPADGADSLPDWSFGVGVLTIEAIDWLQLRRSGHQRMALQWKGRQWEASWVQS